jgi:hypothetical protein
VKRLFHSDPVDLAGLFRALIGRVMGMPKPPATYEEWLALSGEDREQIKENAWNAYARDGIAFPFMAAARLAMQSRHKVLDIGIGTNHGGEYVLLLYVSPEDVKNCPPFLQQSFEGFRVAWLPVPQS